MSFEIHHVHPREYHGDDTPGNLVKICCNAHSDVHHLLSLMLRGKPFELRDYPPAVRTLALRGFRAVNAYAESLAPK